MTPEKLLERLFPPMLATLVSEPPRDERNWSWELKYDGFRALITIVDGEIAPLGSDGRMKDHLKKQIAQFLDQMRRVARFTGGMDRVECLVRLLEQILRKGLICLLRIPRTPSRCPQPGHHGN